MDLLAERRQYPRLGLELLTYVELEPDNGGLLLNLSEGGAAIWAAQPVVGSERVRLNFQVPGFGHDVDTAGRIAWLEEGGKRAGIEFLGLSERARRSIQRWVASGASAQQLHTPIPGDAEQEPLPQIQEPNAVEEAGPVAEAPRWPAESSKTMTFASLFLGHRSLWVALCAVLLLAAGALFVSRRERPEPTSPASVPAEVPAQPTPATGPMPPAGKAPAPSAEEVLPDSAAIPRGAVVLQVAALSSKDNAVKLAQLLRAKGFPAFVLTPSPDRYVRVQVGPYADAESARVARQKLARAGYTTILRRLP